MSKLYSDTTPEWQALDKTDSAPVISSLYEDIQCLKEAINILKSRNDDLQRELSALREKAQAVVDSRGKYAKWSVSEAGALQAIDALASVLGDKP